MAKAGEKELEFHHLISDIDPLLLKGKLEFGTPNDVFVSVDNSIEFDDTIFLIEIDASNMAKLVAGQYTLLNLLSNSQSVKSKKIVNCQSSKQLVFLVVHYYGTGKNKYNPERSMKNFRLIKSQVFESDAINFASVHIEDLKDDIKNYSPTRLEEYFKGLIE